MEVRLLKPHELGCTDQVIDVAPGLANYLVQCNVAEYPDGINVEGIKIKSEPKKRGPKKKDK